ncbi:MAG: toll/interleukin-1 receptor domain-containing protein [Verrucomicrobiaceae bacterium]|nr:toll/interleukin-1 receptor domain-containing protein [Verrucomicrobiaceae bacterium]
MSDFAFDLFLSHNSKDKPEVIRLREKLRELGLKAWLDKEQLPPGQNWQQLIDSGLKNSRAIAACFGEAGVGPWHEEEMQAAMHLAVQEKRPVITVLLPGASREPDLPLFLRSRGWVDFRGGYSAELLERLRWGVMSAVSDSTVTAANAKATDPAEYERRVQEVFGAQYEMLRAILEKSPELRRFLAGHYEVDEAPSSIMSAKLITAFHADFLEAISVFSNGCRKGSITLPVAADLLSSTMYLAMCPDYADQLLKKDDSRVLEMNESTKVRQGIAEMLVAWVDGRGKVKVPLGAISSEKAPGVFHTTPQMSAMKIKNDLMDRVQVDKNAADAATQLDIELDWLRRNEQRQFITMAVRNDADRAVLSQLESSPELKHAVILVVSAEHTMHPRKKAEDADYDQRFDVFLQKIVQQLQPTSATPSKT